MAIESAVISADDQEGAGRPFSPVRLGLVGCGFVGEHRHLPALSRLPEFSVEAVADQDAGALARVAERFAIRGRFQDAAELVADRSVEAVAICVPAASHAEVARAAIEAGKHVFVEKPLALSLDDADSVLEAARGSSVTAVVGFNLRCHRVVQSGRELLRSGAIGAVGSVSTSFADARLSRPDLPPWRTRRELGGGSLVEKAIHHVDLLRHLLDDEMEEVFAFSRTGRGEDETVTICARMGGGALATLHTSDQTITRNELTLNGDDGSLHLDLYRSDGVELVSLDDLPGAPTTRARRLLSGGRQLLAGAAEIRRGGAFDASYEAEWRSFAASVHAGAAPACTLEDGRRSLQAVLAAAQSASTGAPVKVADAPTTLWPGPALPAVET